MWPLGKILCIILFLVSEMWLLVQMLFLEIQQELITQQLVTIHSIIIQQDRVMWLMDLVHYIVIQWGIVIWH